MSAPKSSWRAAADTAVIGLFLAGIAAPSLDRFVRPDSARAPTRESRRAAPKPALGMDVAELNSFPERFEAWYSDSFGLRDKFLRWNSIEKLEFLRVSPTPKIVLGRDDWLFYTGGHSMEVWRGVDPLTTAELAGWQRALEWNRDRLKLRGIEYVFAIGPNKETIYPEHVASRLNRVGPTRLDQLVAHLQAHSDLRILDLRPALLAAKNEDLPGDELYFRDGTHWNGRGALVAYREVIANLARTRPALQALEADRLEQVPVPGTVDSWSDLMYVYDRRPQSASSWRILPRPSARTVEESGPPGAGRVKVTQCDAPGLPRVLFVHDSFGPSFETLLAESCSRLACRWSFGFDSADVEAEKPDVVLQLFVERVLVEQGSEQIAMRDQWLARDAFVESRDVLYSLDPTADPPQLASWNEATCRKVADGAEDAVEIEVRSWKDLALLPELAPGGNAAVCVDVSSSVRTTLLLFYQLDPRDEYLRTRSVSVPLEPGRNRVYLRLDADGIRGRLGLRPGAARGSYLVHGLEIRRVRGPG